MRLINIGLLAHVDAGKTTLAESLLYNSGSIRETGRVDHGDAYLDTDSMEKARGITIFSKQARMKYADLDITLLDTPGHVDFSSEMERVLSVLDLAILVISATEGVQGHTRTLWKLLDYYNIPTIIFVNKMDQPGNTRENAITSIKKDLSPNAVDMTNDESVVFEEISSTSEELIELFLEKSTLSNEEVRMALEQRLFFPVWFGSALKNEGVLDLLTGIDKYAPAPLYDDSFGARVFKITRDSSGKRLTHMKITGGTLLPKMIPDPESGEKIDQLRLYSGTKYESITSAAAGQVVAVTGLSTTYAGQGLGIETENILPVLEPVLNYKLLLPPGLDSLRFYGEIGVLMEEYPELRLEWNEQHKEIHVSVNGEIQTQILKNLIMDRFNTEIDFGAGSIVYKETLGAPSYGIGHFEPLRHYAEVQLLVEPGEAGSGIEFVSACSLDILDRNWQRLIETHVNEARHPGVLTGSEATDLRIILMTGRAHPKHTEGGDFRQATYRAIRNALRKGESVLLEPIYQFLIDLPSDQIGRAMTDIERLYGKAEAPEMSADGSTCILKGTAPVSTFWEYQKELSAYTAGRGHLTCSFAGYAPCHNQDEVVAQRGYDPEADLRRPTGSVFCAHGAGFQVPWNEVADYAHMESPLSEKTENKADTFVAKNSQTGSHEEKYISLEEIDAIFAGQHKNKKAEAASARKRYKKTFGQSLTAGKLKPTLPKCLLVDGYNMIHAWSELKPLVDTNIDGARGRLIDICSEYQSLVGGELILVFDAYLVPGGIETMTKMGNIYVVYTKEAETADQYIEQATRRKSSDYRVTVATSDHIEQLIVWSEGALRMSAPEFEQEIERARHAFRENYLNEHNRLGNTLPLEGINIVD